MPSVCSYLYGLFFIRVSSSSRVYYFHPWEFNSLTMNQQISYLSPCQDKDIYMNCLCWLGRGGGYELLLNSLISFRNISYRVFFYLFFLYKYLHQICSLNIFELCIFSTQYWTRFEGTKVYIVNQERSCMFPSLDD